MAKKEKKEAGALGLPPLEVQKIRVRIEGDSPLICHAWSEKAKKQMRDKQMKKARAAKEAKDPQRDFEESLYPHPEGGFGFPAVAFKAAIVDACSHVEGVTKVLARGALHVDGELVSINGDPEMREDMVRVGMGVADLRYRGQFFPWSTKLEVRYNARVMSAEQVAHLLNTAGFAIGVGEWRPQRNGNYGMFHVSGMENA